MADFNFYLNRQGAPGRQGEKGEQGFSPIITVASDTLSEYILRIQTENNIILTSNLREHKEDLGGTYLRYDRARGVMYIGEPVIGDENNFGVVKFASSQDITNLDDTVATTPNDVDGMIEGKGYGARFAVLEGRVDAAELSLDDLESSVSNLTTRVTTNESNIAGLATRISTAENNIIINSSDIDNIESLIPIQASSGNQLADKNFVNSSIATATATFRGTYNSVADLEAYAGEKDNNDYAYVTGVDAVGNTYYDNYVFDGTNWIFRYRLNNSSFTAAQFAAINSGATSTNIAQIGTNTSDIASLSGRMSAAEGNISLAQGDIATNANNILTNTSDIATLQSAMTTAQSNISSLQSAMNDKLESSDLSGLILAGRNITITENSVTHALTISGQQAGTTYAAGKGINLDNDTISIDSTVATKGDVYAPNVDIVGTLTENDNVLSGFSATNYGKLPITTIPYNTCSSLEIVCKFTTGADVSNSQWIQAGCSPYQFGGVCLGIHANKFAMMIASNNRNAWDIAHAGSTGLSQISPAPNTDYYLKATFDGSTYKLYYATSDEIYMPTGVSINNSTRPSDGTNVILGAHKYTQNGTETVSNPFLGSIDFNGCYIKLNGIMFWDGTVDRFYSKSETDTLLDAKANVSDVYNRSEVDNKLTAKQDVLTPNEPLTISTYAKSNLVGFSYTTDGTKIYSTNGVGYNANFQNNNNVGTIITAAPGSSSWNTGTYSANSWKAYIDIPYNINQIAMVPMSRSYCFGKILSDGRFIPIYYPNSNSRFEYSDDLYFASDRYGEYLRRNGSGISSDSSNGFNISNSEYLLPRSGNSYADNTCNLIQIFEHDDIIDTVVRHANGNNDTNSYQRFTDQQKINRLREVNVIRCFACGSDRSQVEVVSGRTANTGYPVDWFRLYNSTTSLYDIQDFRTFNSMTNLFDLAGVQSFNYLDLHIGTGLAVQSGNLINTNPTAPSVMTGATSSTAGTSGLVPAPTAGDDSKFLAGDGTFKTVSGGSSYEAGNAITIGDRQFYGYQGDHNNFTTFIIDTSTEHINTPINLHDSTGALLTDGAYTYNTDPMMGSSITFYKDGTYYDNAFRNSSLDFTGTTKVISANYTAGDNVSISNDIISADGYLAGENITIQDMTLNKLTYQMASGDLGNINLYTPDNESTITTSSVLYKAEFNSAAEMVSFKLASDCTITSITMQYGSKYLTISRTNYGSAQYTIGSSTTIKKVVSANIPTVTVDQTFSASSTNAQSGTAVAGAIANKVTGDGISTIKALTQAQYDALSTKDANTFYVIIAASSSS